MSRALGLRSIAAPYDLESRVKDPSPRGDGVGETVLSFHTGRTKQEIT